MANSGQVRDEGMSDSIAYLNVISHDEGVNRTEPTRRII